MRQRWYGLLVLMLLVALGASVAFAANGKISGVVKGNDGTAAVGANVVVEGTALGASADVNGKYFILNVPPGTYRVRASGVGFAPKVITNVRVGSDQIVTLDFSLQSEAVGLSEVVIEASRPPVDISQTSARSRLGSDEFQSLPAANIRDVVSTSASTYKGFVRGGKVYETKTMVDGIDVTDQFGAWYNDVPGGSTPYLTYNGVVRTNEATRSSLVELNTSSIEEANVLTGGVGADYNSATAGLISYSLREGRGKWTGMVAARMSQGGGLEHLGPNVYADEATYFATKATLAASTDPNNRAKAQRFTYYNDKYPYMSRPEMLFNASIGGAVTEQFGLYATGSYFSSSARMPNEYTQRANASLKLNYNFTPDMRLNFVGMMEDRGQIFGWKNTVYQEDFRFYLEGLPTWTGLNLVGSLKWTHVLNPETYYEVQVSMVNDQAQRGYSDDDGDGTVELGENGDYLEFADTAQVNRYMAKTGGQDFSKWFSPTPRNEVGSEVGVTMSGAANWKIARPGIYYEDFNNTTTTLRADVTSQVSANHQLRGGIQARLHNLDMVRRAGYIGGYFPNYQNYVNEEWDVQPKEYSAYVQDKMEYAGLIINLGLRLDGLDLAAGDYSNFFAPFQDVTDATGGPIRVPVRGENTDIKWFLSPRLGVSHPISERAAMYFSFARMMQSQPFSRLYTNYNDFGNPSLPVTVRTDQDPVQSTSYDLGIQWSFYQDFGLDVNAYYKDIQNYSTFGLQVTPRAPYRLYILSTNFGYADSRGVELTLRKNIGPVSDWLGIGGRVSYAYSYIKNSVYTGGNVSSYSTVAGDSAKYGGQLPFDDLKYFNSIERNVLGGISTLTGGYDRPHRVTFNLFFRFPYEITLTSIGTFSSGFYYPLSLADPRSRELGEGPWNKRVDMRLEKAFTFEKIGRFSIYVDALNVFNWVNIQAYYNNTSLPQTQIAWERDGDPTGGPTVNRPASQDGTLIYDIPREIYFGVSYNF